MWNKKRLKLSTAKIFRNGVAFERVYTPRMIQTKGQELQRQPYFARFTPQGMPGGSSFEIRLICVHTYFGDDNAEDRVVRQKELNTLLTEVYPQLADLNFQNGLPKYTILLGDYNAEIVTETNKQVVEQRNAYRRSQNQKIPAVMETDGEGNVYSEKYDVTVKTVQDQLTTLKKKENTEEYDDRGYASNYDHFSYDEDAIGHVLNGRPRRIDAVRKYCDDDFEKYYKTISDHIPIIMELRIN